MFRLARGNERLEMLEDVTGVVFLIEFDVCSSSASLWTATMSLHNAAALPERSSRVFINETN